ncbi:MAG: MerR family transcriptional regulator [bacterium]
MLDLYGGVQVVDKKSLLCSSDVTKRLGISHRQLYYWELKGIVRPRYVQMGSRRFKRYTREDLRKLRRMKDSLDEGYTLEAASRKAMES